MWQIKGDSYLAKFSGTYEKTEAFAVLVLALERSKSIVDFDALLLAYDERGQNLPASQALERLSQS